MLKKIRTKEKTNKDKRIANALFISGLLGWITSIILNSNPLVNFSSSIIFIIGCVIYYYRLDGIELKEEKEEIMVLVNPLYSTNATWRNIKKLKKEKYNFDNKESRELVGKKLKEIDTDWFPITKNKSHSYRGKTINKLDEIKGYFKKPCLDEFRSYLSEEKTLKDIAERLRNFNIHNHLDYKITQFDEIIKKIEDGINIYPEIEQNRFLKPP